MKNIYNISKIILPLKDKYAYLIKDDELLETIFKELKPFNDSFEIEEDVYFNEEKEGYKLDLKFTKKTKHNYIFLEILEKEGKRIEEAYNKLSGEKTYNPSLIVKFDTCYFPKDIRIQGDMVFSDYECKKINFTIAVKGIFKFNDIEVENPIILKGSLKYNNTILLNVCKIRDVINL